MSEAAWQRIVLPTSPRHAPAVTKERAPRAPALLSLAVAAAFVPLVACSANAPGAPADAAAPTPPLPVAPSAPVAPPAADAGGEAARPVVRSPGCGAIPREGPGISARKTLAVAGSPSAREYFTALPGAYDPTRAYPVVLVLHGATDTRPDAQVVSYPLQKYAPNAIYVYPQALPRTRADGTGGLVTRWDLEGEEDLAYVDALLAELARTYCVAETHAFATGFSSGGNFAQQLGCKRKKSIAAIAPVSGPGPFAKTCDGPMPVFMTHDADDPALPIVSARASRDFWVAQNGCTKAFAPDTPAECTHAVGCLPGAPVVFCESRGVGHAVAPYAVERVAAHLRGFFPPE